MAKQTKQQLEQVLLDQIAKLVEKVDALEQKQSQPVVVVARKREIGQPRPEVYYVLQGVPTKDLPPQALACARILATAKDTRHIPESEAMALIEVGKQSGRLKTSQPSWRIFQYYRAKLISGDFLLMLTTDGSQAVNN